MTRYNANYNTRVKLIEAIEQAKPMLDKWVEGTEDTSHKGGYTPQQLRVLVDARIERMIKNANREIWCMQNAYQVSSIADLVHLIVWTL